jgi:rRNA processing protein Gar1
VKNNTLGWVSHRSSTNGNLILRAETQTRINEKVYNKKGEKIGHVFDIFGPVDSPFVSVKLEKEVGSMIGKYLFLIKMGKKKQKRKKS